jgi:Protein of unknown function DUF262/HNH endonuclease
MASHVNLDALIPREDFAVSGPKETPKKTNVQIQELQPGAFFYESLRKPDFQRQTEEWDSKRVAGLVRTFIEDELIPAVILWQNKGLTYVIDGSHRLSALIAWVHDDYGDGDLSKKFFNDEIPDEQKKFAKKTRTLVEREFGSYRDHLDSLKNAGAYGPDIVRRARSFGTLSLELQWVKGNVATAENSFIRINQQAAMITPQELELIRDRKQPSVIAARAIIRRGTGHQYWAGMDADKQEKIKSTATEIHRLLFEPPIRSPLNTIALPAGGPVYSGTALRMVFDFIRLSVGTPSVEEDESGEHTIEYLERTKRVIQLIISKEKHSVGLHPAIYFYSWTGKQQPILFLTIAELMMELEQKRLLPKFISVRKDLEQYLIFNRALLNQVVRKFGTKASGHEHVKGFYTDLLDLLQSGVLPEDLTEHLREKAFYKFLQPEESPYEGGVTQRYSGKMKSGIIMRELLMKEAECPQCGGKIPGQAITVDHKLAVKDGGKATVENAQLMHPYCNSAKEKLAIRSQRA